MNLQLTLKKFAVALSFAGVCGSANAAVDTFYDLGALPYGASSFGGFASGFFTDLVKFSLPANGGSGYSVKDIPFSIPKGDSFSISFASIALYSNPDGIDSNDDDRSLFVAAAVNPSTITLNVGPLAAGNYYLLVNGATTGSAGGVYSGGISVSPVPEPETYGLFLAGLGLLGTIMTRRRKPV